MSKAALVTQDEVKMVKEYLVLTIMQDVLRVEIAALTKSGLRMARVLIARMEEIERELPMQIAEVRKAFRRAGIKVVSLDRPKGKIVAEYLCRGYKHEMILQGDFIRSMIEGKMAKWIGVETPSWTAEYP